MFCPTCAHFTAESSDACPQCGSRMPVADPSGSPDQRSGRVAPSPLGRPGLILIPVFTILLVIGWIGWQMMEHQDLRSQAYSRGVEARAGGDLSTALSAFNEAGSYRDAETQRLEIQAEVAPIQSRYFDGIAALDTGDYEAALDLLESVSAQLPGFEDAETLIQTANDQLIESLHREADEQISRRDWLAADSTLARLVELDPADPELSNRLQQLRSEHAPILFVRNHALYQIGPDLVDERLLFDSIRVDAPAWSPDRSSISFLSPDPDDPAIARLFVIDANGDNPQLLATGAMFDPNHVWSPDGSKIAFVAQPADHAGTTSRIGVVDIDSQSLEFIEPGPVGLSANTDSMQLDTSSPTWSPDGENIAFVVTSRPVSPGVGVVSKVGTVQIYNLANRDRISLTGERTPFVSAVSWSPANDTLLIWESLGGTAWFESHETSVHQVDVDSGIITRLTDPTQASSRVFWSPDGVWHASIWGGRIVQIVNTSTGVHHTVELERVAGPYLTWAPFGTALIVIPSNDQSPAGLVELDDGALTITPLQIDFDMTWPNKGLAWGPLTIDANP